MDGRNVVGVQVNWGMYAAGLVGCGVAYLFTFALGKILNSDYRKGYQEGYRDGWEDKP